MGSRGDLYLPAETEENKMRKKSHLSLAAYLIGELESEQLDRHKKAFYLGSILPDLTPKMITSPHEFQTSYRELQEKICDLISYVQSGEGKERVVWRRLGVVMHYLADYFTFPHNTVFDGSLKDHCLYERDMKHAMRTYIHTGDARMIFEAQRMRKGQITNVSELFAYIEKTHKTYLGAVHDVKDDCRWIVEMCSWALIGLVNIICKADEKLQPLQWMYA